MSKCKTYMCDKQIYSLQELEKKMGSTSFMDIPMTKWPEWYKCKYDMVPKILCQSHPSLELKKLKMNLTRLKGELKKCVSEVKMSYDAVRTETNKLKKYKDPKDLKEQNDLIDYLNMDLKNAEIQLIKKESEFNTLFHDIEKISSLKSSPKIPKRCPNGERRNKKTKKCVKF
jgi:hypothetical protein